MFRATRLTFFVATQVARNIISITVEPLYNGHSGAELTSR